MPQYQEFSNPTIIPDHPMGWEAANQQVGNAIGGVTDYMMKQYAVTQGMQADLGKQMLSHKLDSILFPGQYAQMGFGPADAAKLDEMIGQNPYARRMLTQLHSSLGNAGQPQGQPNQPSQGQPMPMGGGSQDGQPGANNILPGGVSMNPVAGIQPLGGQPSGGQAPGAYNMSSVGGSVPTENSRTFKTLFGDINQKSANLGGVAAEASAKAQATQNVEIPAGYAKEIMTSKAKEAAASTTLEGLTKNLVADLKSSFIESGGGGPVRGRAAEISTHLGMSPATYGLQNTTRDTAIAYARNLAGGSQGVQKLFQLIMETIPGAHATPEQAGTAALQMHLTGRQLQSGMENLNLKPVDMKDMSVEDVQKVLTAGTIDRQKETAAFLNILKTVPPTMITDVNGKSRNPEQNQIAKLMNWKYEGGSQNPVTNGRQQAQHPQPMIDKYNQLRASGISMQDAKKQLGM